MGKTDRITERQLSVLILVSLMSPMIRILPSAAVVYGGRAAWLSPVVALIAGKLLLTLTRYLRKNAPEEAGLADLAVLGLGPGAGRVYNVLCALWLTFYGGFVARSAAERLLATVYPKGDSWVFIAVMLIVAVVTASGPTKTLSRTAEVLMPILTAVIAAVLLSAIPDLSAQNLLPVTYRDAGRIAGGAVPVYNVMSAFVYFLFLTGHVKKPGSGGTRRFPWLTGLALLAFAVTLFTLGTLGDKLAITMENAFFMVIRNIRVFGVVERIESVVVAVWIVTDFIFLAAVIMIVSEIWRTVFGVSRRRVFVLPTAVLSGAASFIIAGSAFRLMKWSEYLIPAINMAFSTVLTPAVLAVGKLRKKY